MFLNCTSCFVCEGGTPQLIPKDQGIEIRQRVLYFRSLLDQLPVNHITAGSIYHSDLLCKPKLPYIAPFRHIFRGECDNYISLSFYKLKT